MRHEQTVRLGVFAAVAAGLLVLTAAFFLAPRLLRRTDWYVVDFRDRSVNGLLLGSPVKYQGVEIGRVVRMRVNRRDLSSVIVTLHVERDFPVKADTRAALKYMGITGQRFVELGGGTAAAPRLPPGGEIGVSRGLEEKAQDIVTNVESALAGVNRLLAPGNLDRISTALANVEKSSASIAQVLERRAAGLDRTLGNMDAAAASFASASKDAKAGASELRATVETLGRDGGRVLKELGDRASPEEMGAVLKNLDRFVAEASRSLKTIEGSVLLQQDALNRTFTNLAQALENLSRLSREISEDPAVLLRGRKEKKR